LKTKFLKLLFLIFFSQNTYSQCFEIESILVDACGAQEGLNEMVRFNIGSTPQNTSTLSVTWPNNPWQGLVQNATTASKVATLNADILDAGGCGELIEPSGGVLPANASVILVTSFNFDTALNSFGALTETIYIIFQNNPSTTSGHFANFGSGVRTLTINFGSCSDTVTYDRALLINPSGQTVAADGATVLFTPNGNSTYVNYGCSAPVQPFLVEIDTPSLSACPGDSIALTASAEGQQSVLWTASSGIFSNPGSLTTSYSIPSNATGTILLTLTATNSCGLEISDTLLVTIANNVVPNFATTLTICSGTTAPTLNTTSPNGIVGTWSPATINNTTSGNYVFTPDENQCASPITLVVTVTDSIIPTFDTALTLCTGTTAPALNTTSPNGIVGTWSPATINNTSSGSYIFTPDPNQCGATVTLSVTISNFDFTFTQRCDNRNFIIETVLENSLPNSNYEWTLENSSTLLSQESFLNVTELLNSNSITSTFPKTFSVKIFTDEGCEETKPITIFNAFCGIPKGISPNNDGLNDSFDLSGLGVETLAIFNRYGRKIYSKNNYLNEWFGQSDSGHELPDGTYYFHITKTDGKQETGWIYLIR
jgi:gliding motility-associated-like protein